MMKKRLFAAVTAAMCLTGMLAALPASALTEDEVSSLTITTDTFMYSPYIGFTGLGGMTLTSDLVDADFMVIGYHYEWGDPNEEIIGYVVSSINADHDIGVIYRGSVDRALEIGDLLAVNGMWEATPCYPAYYSCIDDDETNLTFTYVGNGVTIFGDAFKDVIRTQMTAEQADFDENKRSGGALYDIELDISLLNTGDTNLDGALNMADCVLLNRYVLGDAASVSYADLSGDLNEDGVVDVFDLALLKHKLLTR